MAHPLIETIRAASDSPHLAAIHAEARRGLKDLQDVVLQPFPDSKQSRDEPGTIANPTQQLVTEEITGKESNRPEMDMG